jgi:hypothetical protein
MASPVWLFFVSMRPSPSAQVTPSASTSTSRKRPQVVIWVGHLVCGAPVADLQIDSLLFGAIEKVVCRAAGREAEHMPGPRCCSPLSVTSTSSNASILCHLTRHCSVELRFFPRDRDGRRRVCWSLPPCRSAPLLANAGKWPSPNPFRIPPRRSGSIRQPQDKGSVEVANGDPAHAALWRFTSSA